MKKTVILFAAMLCLCISGMAANPIQGLLERIDKGASAKFVIEQKKGETDFFELDQKGNKVVVRGNNYVSIATGINWYLKYYAGIQLSWNGMHATLPAVLPPVTQKERHETNLPYRYDLNYCTFSYTMAFWDWKRWEEEIDWMAMHGINLSLALTGTEVVYKNILGKLGYTKDEVNQFVAGSGFLAWWMMNNLEGWGGPNPDSWYDQQEVLQKRIIKRMKEYGIEPILAGYCGMLPHDAAEHIGVNVADPGLWCSYLRPTFLQPEDARFEEIAKLYYDEMTRLYGKANFYAIDPFHEGGNTKGVNLDAAGKAVMKTMKKANPAATWVIQAWQRNPMPAMIDNLNKGDLLVLDLHSECRPQWGDPTSEWFRKDGYGKHEWLYCMLLNFGGNVGLHGKMDALINGFYDAKAHPHAGTTLRGVGLTPEGTENNPMMFELAMELPWRAERFTREEWLNQYAFARYGKHNAALEQAWQLLGNGIYNAAKDVIQQGTTESILCARPSLDAISASTWAETKDYYTPQHIFEAARLMLSVADEFRGNNNFEYDLIDVTRQAVTEKARLLLKVVAAAYRAGDKALFAQATHRFMEVLLAQDELLATRPEFRLGRWTEQARSLGNNAEEKELYEWNARVQITTWGNRAAAERGGLHDYAHKEWSGLLKDFYRARWQAYFDMLTQRLNGVAASDIDFYPMEEQWTKDFTRSYSAAPVGDCIDTAKRVMEQL